MSDRSIELTRSGAPEVAEDGWYELVEGAGGARTLLHLSWDEQHRAVIDAVHIAGARVLADDLRAVPLGLVERRMNAGAVQAGGADGSVALVEAPLQRSNGESPDEFATRVARQYRYFASVSRAPTKMLAEHSNVPISTARWWVREARRLGALPPGRKGSVG